MKKCAKCHQYLPVTDFNPKGKGSPVLFSYCRCCSIEYGKHYRSKRGKKRGERPQAIEYQSAVAPQENESTLYIMRNPLISGMIKVGRAASPELRAESLSRSHPFELLVCYTYPGWGSLEGLMHEKLSNLRVQSGRGREWFRIEPEHANLLVRAAILENEIAGSAL
jgi:hypothetical protein